MEGSFAHVVTDKRMQPMKRIGWRTRGCQVDVIDVKGSPSDLYWRTAPDFLSQWKVHLARRLDRDLVLVRLLIGILFLGARALTAQTADTAGPITLEAALRQARTHNAQLPVAATAMQAAAARTQQARGLRLPSFSLGTDLHAGAPQSYSSTDAFLRVLGDAPIYSGGELRANVAQANAEASASNFGYRAAVRDVDLAVRTDFARVLRADSTIAFRERALSRLETYFTVVQAHQAAGLGVGADILRTRQRLAAAHAEITSAQRDLDDARMALNDDLGRAPLSDISVSPLPDPMPLPDSVQRDLWSTVPDVARSQAMVQAAAAGVDAAHAGRKLHLSLEADVGTQPHLGSTEALLNNGTGSGGEVMLSFSLPFLDWGVYNGRVAEAKANLQQALGQADVTRRQAQLNWTRAAAAVSGLYTEYQARIQALSAAQDAYLETESLYRGGQGTSLDVLDSYDAWVQAEQDRLDVEYTYWVAQADLIRWGSR
jgi:outer membrane protein TolC